LNTLRSGHWPAFYDTQGGKEAMWMWLLAAFFSVADVGPLQIRLVAAIVGLITVGAAGWAAYELFAADEETSATDLALLAAAVMATLFVHIHFSRSGYRLITQPLIGTLALAACGDCAVRTGLVCRPGRW
jgi:4-amino-4-deoxy-L-arabinose transferase-like glycosyltransferase